MKKKSNEYEISTIGDCGVHAGSSKAGGKSLTSTIVMTKLPSPTCTKIGILRKEEKSREVSISPFFEKSPESD